MGGIRLQGLIAAAFSPMDDTGALALDRVPEIVETVLARGNTAFYVCGSTGEWASLSTAERQQVAEAYVSAVAGRVPVVVQVGDFNVNSACELARHAAAIGADAISASAPSYYPARSPETVIECMARVAAAAGDLPFYYYYIPALSPTAMDADAFLESATARIPSLAGIKYSGGSLHEYLRLLQRVDADFEVLFGCDEQYLQGLASGAQGAIGSTYNFMAPIYSAIEEAFNGGSVAEARRLQDLATRIVLRIVEGPQPHAGLKAAMALSGCDCGPVRLPQRPMTPGEIDALRRDLDRLGFFEWTMPAVAK